jgi:hypothetical protein
MNLSIPAVIATIADFLFTANERVPDRRRPRRPADLAPFDHTASDQLLRWLLKIQDCGETA